MSKDKDKDGKKKMPSVTITRVQVAGDGRVRFRFGKREREFNSIAQVVAAFRDRFDRDDMELIAMAMCIARQPTLNNPNQLEGKTLTVNLGVANWGTVS